MVAMCTAALNPEDVEARQLALNDVAVLEREGLLMVLGQAVGMGASLAETYSKQMGLEPMTFIRLFAARSAQ